VADEAVEHLNRRGEKVGLVKVRLYRPFDSACFARTLPASVKAIAVLDRTKEPGAAGEPLYQDCLTALMEHSLGSPGQKRQMPLVLGGRYGLSSKEFTPAMVKAVFDNLAAAAPKNHFTVGITDDVSFTSLPVDGQYSTEPDEVIRAQFYGLGSDGTVGANKNTIKIIGENTAYCAQGYFVYDSKKSGSMTVSHLRFGKDPIRSSYLITRANFIACHQPIFLERFDMLRDLVPGGTFLLNSPHSREEIWRRLPTPVQQALQERRARKRNHGSGVSGFLQRFEEVRRLQTRSGAHRISQVRRFGSHDRETLFFHSRSERFFGSGGRPPIGVRRDYGHLLLSARGAGGFVRQHEAQRLRWLEQSPGLFGSAPGERQQQCRKPARGLPW
jgi:hypothetical protein